MGKKDLAGDGIRRLVGSAKGGMASSRFEKIIQWAKSTGNEELAAKLSSGQITADELHQANSAYFESSRPRPMADAPARQMELPMNDGPPPNDLRPLFGDQADWEETGNIAARILNEGQRGMIPYGTRGPGVAVGGPSGPGVTGGLSGPGTRQGQMINDPRMSDPDYIDPEFRVTPNQPPAVVKRGMIDPRNPNRAPDEMPRGLTTDVDLPRLGDGVLRGDTTSRPRGRQYRGSGAEGRPLNAPRGRGALTAAGAAGLGGIGIYSMMDGEPKDEQAIGDMTDTSGTEALAEESRPVPATVEGPPDYSYQARELINQLNAMRREAGGEVPEAPAMMAEINRLLDMSNRQRNAPGYEPPMPTDYHGEAQRLIQRLNAMNQEMGGMSPETPRIMAEVRRLQALGDEQRNARR
jgi:hypothetical protein